MHGTLIKETTMRFESQLLKGIAPVVVLEILSRGSMYGYQLSQAIKERSQDVFTLGKAHCIPCYTTWRPRGLSRVDGRPQTQDVPDGIIRSPAKVN